MTMPPGEAVDRLSILVLKLAHGLAVSDELAAYRADFMESHSPDVLAAFFDLLDVNAAIWQLEWQLRQGRDAEVGLEELGRRALAIRDLNATRVAAKNRINEIVGRGWREQKTDHVSER
jgi:hypothetical protein